MSLPLILYFINLSDNLHGVLIGATMLSGLATVICLVIVGDVGDDGFRRWGKKWLIISISCSIVGAFIPSQKTLYMMVAAHYSEVIMQNSKVQVLEDKVYKILSDKLDEFTPKADKK